MFDIGWQELFLVCIITVLIVGPRELPRVVRGVTGFIRKARMMASEFQTGLTDIADATDLAELRKGVEEIKDGTLPKRIASAADPTGMLGKEIQEIKDTQNRIASEFNAQVEESKIKTETDTSLPKSSPPRKSLAKAKGKAKIKSKASVKPKQVKPPPPPTPLQTKKD